MSKIGTRTLLAFVVLACAGAALWYWSGQEPGKAPRRLSEPLPVICIDPGHPSESNSGRHVQNGVTELDMNWQVAQKLEAVLKKNSHVQVMHIRKEKDRYVRNSNRAKIANRMDAALVLHLHCDTGGGNGYTIYYPDKKGGAEGKVGPEPEVIAASELAAKAVNKEMKRVLRGHLNDRGIRGDSSTYWGSRNGALTCSIFSEIPTLTVEMVFLSSKHDARFILSEHGQWKMAEALARGTVEFLRTEHLLR